MNINEYSGTTTVCPCYSNLKDYDVQGRWKSIKPPTPVTLIPEIFNLGIKPHNLNNSKDIHRMQKTNCVPYENIDNICPEINNTIETYNCDRKTQSNCIDGGQCHSRARCSNDLKNPPNKGNSSCCCNDLPEAKRCPMEEEEESGGCTIL